MVSLAVPDRANWPKLAPAEDATRAALADAAVMPVVNERVIGAPGATTPTPRLMKFGPRKMEPPVKPERSHGGTGVGAMGAISPHRSTSSEPPPPCLVTFRS